MTKGDHHISTRWLCNPACYFSLVVLELLLHISIGSVLGSQGEKPTPQHNLVLGVASHTMQTCSVYFAHQALTNLLRTIAPTLSIDAPTMCPLLVERRREILHNTPMVSTARPRDAAHVIILENILEHVGAPDSCSRCTLNEADRLLDDLVEIFPLWFAPTTLGCTSLLLSLGYFSVLAIAVFSVNAFLTNLLLALLARVRLALRIVFQHTVVDKQS